MPSQSGRATPPELTHGATAGIEDVDVKTAQAILGHSESRLTLDVYAHAVTAMGEAAAAAIGARFFGSTPRMDVRWSRTRAGTGQ